MFGKCPVLVFLHSLLCKPPCAPKPQPPHSHSPNSTEHVLARSDTSATRKVTTKAHAHVFSQSLGHRSSAPRREVMCMRLVGLGWTPAGEFWTVRRQRKAHNDRALPPTRRLDARALDGHGRRVLLDVEEDGDGADDAAGQEHGDGDASDGAVGHAVAVALNVDFD